MMSKVMQKSKDARSPPQFTIYRLLWGGDSRHARSQRSNGHEQKQTPAAKIYI